MKTLSQIIKETYSEGTDWSKDLAVQAIQSKLKKAKVSYRDPNAKTAREEDRIAKKLAAQAKMKKEEVEIDEQGLWDNIHAKRKRIKAGSGERMRKPGSEGAPTAQDFKDASVKEAYNGQPVNSAALKPENYVDSKGRTRTKMVPVKLNITKEETNLDENGIKGWKHAGSDISKMRAAAGKDVKLVRLKKDGTENKMHDATKMFRSEDEAQQHHDRVVGLNPKTKIAHNLYVNGKHVKKLGEEAEYDEWAEMTRSELKIAINSAKEILDMMDEGIEIERWQVSEIVTASDSLATVYQNLCADNDYEEDEE